jgi:hypothetical protein
MCERCNLIDSNIRKLRQIEEPGLDRLSLAAIQASIASMEAEKVDLHCKTPE